MTARNVSPQPGDVQRLVETISALRDEIRGLRAAGQLRAVIEQAKGVLMERTGIGPEEAFAQLRKLSQEHNVRLVEVAATVVGAAIPSAGPELDAVADTVREYLPASVAASPVWRALQEQPDVRAGVLAAMLDVVTGGTRRGDDAASLLVDLLAPHEVDAVALYRRSADESLRLVGQFGLPGDLMSSWSHIPPSPNIPYVAAVQKGRPILWASKAERDRQFPAMASMPATFQGVVVVPITEGDAVVGVVGVLWSQGRELPEDGLAWIGEVVQRVGAIVLRNAEASDPELEWMTAVLGLVFDPWILLDASPRSDGPAGDFVVLDLAASLPGRDDVAGRRLLELWPSLGLDGTAGALSSLAANGGTWTITMGVAAPSPWGEPGTRLRAVRVGRRIVLVWRGLGR